MYSVCFHIYILKQHNYEDRRLCLAFPKYINEYYV